MTIASVVTPGRLARQGAENFKKELEQLRRAFRYDEFETVTAAATPPKNIVVKACVDCAETLSYGMAAETLLHAPDEWLTALELVLQAVKSAGAKVVAGFASLDRQLQKAGILPELKPVKLPAEVRDESGQLASDCAEVGIFVCAQHSTPRRRSRVSCRPG